MLCLVNDSGAGHSRLSEHSQPAVAAAGDHVADLGPGVQVRVVDLHGIHRYGCGEVSGGCSSSNRIQQPVYCRHRYTCACRRHRSDLHPFLLRTDVCRREENVGASVKICKQIILALYLLWAVLLYCLQSTQSLVPAAHSIYAVIETCDAHVGPSSGHDGQGAPSTRDGIIHLCWAQLHPFVADPSDHVNEAWVKTIAFRADLQNWGFRWWRAKRNAKTVQVLLVTIFLLHDKSD